MRDTGIHHLRMLLIISKITFILFVPVWALVDLSRILSDDTVVSLIASLCQQTEALLASNIITA